MEATDLAWWLTRISWMAMGAGGLALIQAAAKLIQEAEVSTHDWQVEQFKRRQEERRLQRIREAGH